MDQISEPAAMEPRAFEERAQAKWRTGAWSAPQSRADVAVLRPLEPMPDWQKVTFPQSEAEVPAGWRVRDDVYVAGLHHHRDGVNSFFEAAWAGLVPAEAIELVRKPAGHKGVTVISVIGRYYEPLPAKKARNVRPVVHRAPLGHLPFEVAAELAEASADTPLRAELRECAWLPGEPDSKVILIALWLPGRAPVLQLDSSSIFRRFSFGRRGADQDGGGPHA